MDTQQLLMPRYECIGKGGRHYTYNPFKVGDILYPHLYTRLKDKDYNMFSTIREGFNYHIHEYVEQDHVEQYPPYSNPPTKELYYLTN